MAQPNRIRRIIPSHDDGADVLVLSDAPTIAVYKKNAPSHQVRSSTDNSNIHNDQKMPLYVLRTEPRTELPNSPMDASWCPYKKGEANSSFLCTAWGAPIRLVDVEDGTIRASYFAANTMDEVCYAQSVLWLRSPARQEQFIGGYGRALECCVGLFDVMREGKSPLWTYEPTAAKCCNFSGDASSSAVIVSALAEVRNNLVSFGTLRGSVEFVDLRSKCCAGAISGWTASGSGNAFRGAAAEANFVRHTAGVVQILSLDGPTLAVDTPSLVRPAATIDEAAAASKLAAEGKATASHFSTSPDDHRFITVPRCGDDNILAWDMRNLSNPVTVIRRGPTTNNTLRNIAVTASGKLIVPTQTQGIAAIPLTDIFTTATNSNTGASSASSLFLSAMGVNAINVSDYLSSELLPPMVEMDASQVDSTCQLSKSMPYICTREYRSNANVSQTIGPIATVGDFVIVTRERPLYAQQQQGSQSTAVSSEGTVVAAKPKYLADRSGFGLLGGKRGRKAGELRRGAALDDDDDAEDSDVDYVVLRSRKAYRNAAAMKVVISDDDEE